MQWSFTNKTHPQLVSFQGSQEDKPKMTGFDALASAGLVSITTADAFDSSRRPSFSGGMQKNLIHEKQAGAHYTVSAYGHHGAVPSVPYVPVVLNSCPLVGTTDLRTTPKTSTGPAQLTIFYNGSVCVYDDVTPEKAQAIMILAGNGSSTSAPNTALPASQMLAQIQRPSSMADGFVMNKSHCITLAGSNVISSTPVTTVRLQAPISRLINGADANRSRSTTPCRAPISVSSHSGGRSSCSNEMIVIKPSSSNKSDAPIMASPIRSIPPSIPSAVPQARKASLARFLEKRKERVMNSSPYSLQQSADMKTSGSSTLPAVN